MKPLLLLVPATRKVSDDALRELRDQLACASGVRVAPLAIPSAALLPRMLEEVPGALAWASASAASALLRTRGSSSLVTVCPADGVAPSAVLAGHPSVEGLADLAGRHIGWVSRLSETGYEVPRLYLESFGVDPSALFASERFCGSHGEAIEALARGEVDVIATHSGRLRDALARTRLRIVASVGPMPPDTIVAGPEVSPGVRHDLTAALARLTWHGHAFARVPTGHLDLFDVLRRQARELLPPLAHPTPAFASY